jgi:hypothetical protein
MFAYSSGRRYSCSMKAIVRQKKDLKPFRIQITRRLEILSRGVRFFADIPLVFWRHLTNIVVGGYIQLIFELGLRYRMFYDLN